MNITLQQAMEDLKNAFNQMNAVLLEMDDTSVIDKGYPFHKDFNELTHDVMEWVETNRSATT